MALTYTVKAISAVAANDVVAGFLDSNNSKLFTPAAEALAVSGANANAYYPTVGTISQVKDSAGASTGPFNVHLTPGASNTVEAPSVMNYVLSTNAFVVEVSGTF